MSALGGTSGVAVSRRLLWSVALGAAVLSAVAAVALTAGVFGALVASAAGAVGAVAVVSYAVEGRRRAVDRVFAVGVCAAFAVALYPLVSVLSYVVSAGLARLDGTFWSHSMRNVGPGDVGGGAYHAVLGTLEQVGLATVVAVPLGLLVAIYLVEFGRGRLAVAVTFFVDVMTGVPSIVAGLFVFTAGILLLGFQYSGVFGSVALAVLMVPVVVRTCEEMLRLVPGTLREAAYALGVNRWRTVLRVVVPTALPGVVTGVMLAVARVTGETAPLLLTTFYSASINGNPFGGAQGSLPVFVWTEWQKGLPAATDRAAAGALALIALVMVLNLLARLVTWRVGRR